jgi:hypothetical protein
MDRQELLIGGGVAVGAAVLVLFLKGRGSSGGQAVNNNTGGMDVIGGFATAPTVYVPTSDYNIVTNNYGKNSSVSYSTVTNNNNSQTTTTYSNNNNGNTINSPSGGGSVNNSPVNPAPAPIPPAPVIIGGGGTVNPPTQQTGTQPAAPAPVAPPPPPAFKLMGNMHYATPAGGWNPNSVVDYVKEHGGYSDFGSRAILAQQYGISNYQGTESQNITFLQKLKQNYGNY